MTPERLQDIEVQFRRHPASPHNVELAHELIAELRKHVSLPVDAVAPRLEDPTPTPEPTVETPAPEAAATPPATPTRKARR